MVTGTTCWSTLRGVFRPCASPCSRGRHRPFQGNLRHQDPELLALRRAAKLSSRAGGAYRGDDLPQDVVARQVAVGVVDALEVVDVEGMSDSARG